jgi:hypothetical protein
MSDEPISFIDYRGAVDDALSGFFGTDTWDAGIDADLIASAQEEGQTPEEFARLFGKEHGLVNIED